MKNLSGKTLFITGATRGIGFEIAKKAAKDGANIVIAAKTDTPHPTLPGTIHTAAEELKKAGACFGQSGEYERPMWFALNGSKPEYKYSFNNQNER